MKRFFLSTPLLMLLFLLSCSDMLNDFRGVPAPVFSPPGGIYFDTVSLVLSSSRPGVSVHYTLDGTTPTASSTLYSGAVTLLPGAASIEVRAIAVNSGFSQSPVSSARYAVVTGFAALVRDPALSASSYGEPVVIATADQGLLLGCFTTEGGSMDLLLVKLTCGRAIEWQRRIGGPHTDWLSAIEETGDGGFLVAGKSRSFGTLNGTNEDFFLVKLDASGSIVWQKAYEGNGTQCAFAVRRTVNNGFLVAGRTTSFGVPNQTFWVLHVNADGVILRETAFANNAFRQAVALVPEADGGYTAAGRTNGGIGIVRCAADGGPLWQKNYGGIVDEDIDSIVKTPDGGYLALGESNSFSADTRIWLLKLNAAGAVQWSRVYACAGYLETHVRCEQSQCALHLTGTGGYCVAGYATTAADADFLILNLAGDGSVLWQRTFSASASSVDYAFSIDAFGGGWLIAGQTGGSQTSGLPLIILAEQDGAVTGSGLITGAPGVTVADILLTEITVIDIPGTTTATAAVVVDTAGTVSTPSAAVEVF